MQNLYLTLIFILNLIFGFNFMLKIKFGKRDKISDCPSGVARPAKQPEFQLVLH